MFLDRERKGQQSPVTYYEKSRNNKADRCQVCPFSAKDRFWAGRQEDRQIGKDCSASENGKLPGLHNQLVIFDQPEPRHQLLWDNQQPSEAWWAAGTLGTTGQWPAGKGLVNKAHRAKSRRCPSLKCCMKAAKQTSSTAKPLFPSCRLSTVAPSQARHPLRRPLDGEVGCVKVLLQTLPFYSRTVKSKIHSRHRTNAHTQAAHTPVPVILW